MALINIQQRELHCKLVYYGPGMAGKTTCLQFIHSKTPREARGELLSIATETERTLFFDLIHPEKVRGFTLRFHLYTVPGCTLYERTRVKVLEGADGVIFLADSHRKRLGENQDSLKELVRFLSAKKRDVKTMPIVVQYSKRDLPERDLLPVAKLNKYLNPLGWPSFESSAWVRDEGVSYHAGLGVFDAFYALTKLVIAKL